MGRLVGQRHGLRKLTKPRAETGREDGAEFGQHQTACRALEQRLAELLFSAADLLADGTDGNVELAGGRRERAEAGDGFDGAKAVEMDAIEHGHLRFSKPFRPKSQLKDR